MVLFVSMNYETCTKFKFTGSCKYFRTNWHISTCQRGAPHVARGLQAFAKPHGSVQQTLLDTFDCRAIFFWTNVAISGSARLKILKELRNTLTKIKNIMMTKLPPTNWVIRFWGLETSSANFSYRWTEATIPTYYSRLRTESRFRNASEFTLDLAHSIWRLLELASNPTKNIRGQHFPKGVSQTVEEFWSDDSWQFTKLSNGFHKVAQQPGPTWFLSNIALAYCNLQERTDPDSLGLTSQITDVSTNCVPNYFV